MKPEDLEAHLAATREAGRPTDREVVHALAFLLDELPALVKTDKYGFSREAHEWESAIRRGLTACAQVLIERDA